MTGARTPRVVVITGASGGIGAEMARQLAAKEGAGVALVLAARNTEQLEAVAGQCTALGAQALAMPTDVSVRIQCRRLVITAAEQFGRIDVLVNKPAARRMRISKKWTISTGTRS